jgi:serine/threonine protein kinase
MARHLFRQQEMPPSLLPEAPDSESRGRSLRSGRVIFSRYRLEHPLGQGGMGVVWLAHDRNLDRPLALKFLGDPIYSHPEARDALKRETRRAVELAHPNIVRVHDFVEDGESGAIALEYIDGATLTELRLEHRQGCLEVGGLGSWVAELCRAIDYAHETGQMVHADLKPANLLISSAGMLKVTDFGVGCALRRAAAMAPEQSGSLGYLSPQQHRREAPATSDDIYSIGAILYEALTSRPPMISLQVDGRMPDSMTNRRLKLGVAGEPIPKDWEETVLACLEKEPQNRPASAAEIARRLDIDIAPAAQSEPSCSEHEVELGPESPAIVRPHEARADHRSRARKRAQASTVLLSSAFSAAVAFLSRAKRQVAPALADLFAAKVEPAWRWLGQRKDLGLGASIIAAGAVLVSAYWPRSEEPTEWHPVRRSRDSAIPAYAITVPDRVALTTDIAPGGIAIKSNPSGAAVVVDGVGVQMTPASVEGLAPGEHAVDLQLVGFNKVSIPTVVHAGQLTDLGTIALQRSSGTLQVTTDPPGAQIMLGQRELGRTPMTVKLPSGAYRSITARLDGYADTSFDATVEADETLALPPLMLKSEPPRLAISTEPAGISFQLFHGSAQSVATSPVSSGVTPATLGDLRPGTYRVVFGSATSASPPIAVVVGERGITPLHQVFRQGTLKVESTPAGAEVFEGDKSLGVTPVDIALLEGTHLITAELGNRSARPRTVKIDHGELESLRFDFTTSNSASNSSHSRKSSKKPEPGALTKIGRSIKNLFH